jgi:predicted RNA-binding Zn-ribbon protein involved in translation (DUF1610 family)
MKFRILAALAMLLLSAPSALGVQRALAPTRGELAGWLAALGIELAYLSLAFIEFDDVQRQRNAARVAKTAVATAIVLNVLADYAARVPAGLTSAAAFLGTFDWLLLALSVLESAPLAGLAYTLAVLLHTRSIAQHSAADAEHLLSNTQHCSADAAADAQHLLSIQQQMQQHSAVDADSILRSMLTSAATDAAGVGSILLYTSSTAQHSAVDAQHLRSSTQHQQHTADTTQQMQQYTTDAASSIQHSAVSTQQHQQQMLSNTQKYADAAQQHSAASAQHTAAGQRTASYACPRCGAALTQQQYAAARRYGHCAKCKKSVTTQRI